MAAFTTEADVRAKFGLTDTVLAPSALMVASINDAHAEIVRYLKPEYDTEETPADDLVRGETLLAGARAYETLAAKDAFEQKTNVVGGQRIEAGRRFDALTATAKWAEEKAWNVLAPYLTGPPTRFYVLSTETMCD